MHARRTHACTYRPNRLYLRPPTRPRVPRPEQRPRSAPHARAAKRVKRPRAPPPSHHHPRPLGRRCARARHTRQKATRCPIARLKPGPPPPGRRGARAHTRPNLLRAQSRAEMRARARVRIGARAAAETASHSAAAAPPARPEMNAPAVTCARAHPPPGRRTPAAPSSGRRTRRAPRTAPAPQADRAPQPVASPARAPQHHTRVAAHARALLRVAERGGYDAGRTGWAGRVFRRWATAPCSCARNFDIATSRYRDSAAPDPGSNATSQSRPAPRKGGFRGPGIANHSPPSAPRLTMGTGGGGNNLLHRARHRPR